MGEIWGTRRARRKRTSSRRLGMSNCKRSRACSGPRESGFIFFPSPAPLLLLSLRFLPSMERPANADDVLSVGAATRGTLSTWRYRGSYGGDTWPTRGSTDTARDRQQTLRRRPITGLLCCFTGPGEDHMNVRVSAPRRPNLSATEPSRKSRG